LLSYIFEYDQNDLQNAQYWMNKAYYLPSSENKNYLKQETERQNKKANPVVVDKTALLNQYLSQLEGKCCIKPNLDQKILDQAVALMRINPSYSKFGGEEDLKKQEIIGVYVSKMNIWAPPIIGRQVIIFTQEKLFSNFLFAQTTQTEIKKTLLGEMQTSLSQNLYSYCIPYRNMVQFENIDFKLLHSKCVLHAAKAIHMIYILDTNYNEGNLAYYPKLTDGNILMNLLKALADTEKKDALNTNLRTQIFLQETKDLKAGEQVFTDFFHYTNGDLEDIFGNFFNKK